MNAAPMGYDGANAFHDLHILTGRVGTEDVASFLLNEAGVPPVVSAAEAGSTIGQARAIFAAILGRA